MLDLHDVGLLAHEFQGTNGIPLRVCTLSPSVVGRAAN